TSNCPPSGPSYPIKEQHKIRVDGLGREIEKWDTTSDDGNIYTLYQTTATSYVDTVVGTTPTSFTSQTRLDNSPTSAWKQEKTEQGYRVLAGQRAVRPGHHVRIPQRRHAPARGGARSDDERHQPGRLFLRLRQPRTCHRDPPPRRHLLRTERRRHRLRRHDE